MKKFVLDTILDDNFRLLKCVYCVLMFFSFFDTLKLNFPGQIMVILLTLQYFPNVF